VFVQKSHYRECVYLTFMCACMYPRFQNLLPLVFGHGLNNDRFRSSAAQHSTAIKSHDHVFCFVCFYLDRLVGKVDLIRDELVPPGKFQGEMNGRFRFDPVDLGNGHGWILLLRDKGKTTSPTVVARGDSVVGADGTRGCIVGVVGAAAAIDVDKKLLLEALLFEDAPPGHHFELLAPSLSLGELVFQATDAKGRFVVTVVDGFVVKLFLEV
jgi:hypothetical protein